MSFFQLLLDSSGIYYKMKNGKREYALVFEGTNDPEGSSKDWKTNFDQALGDMDEWQLSEAGLMEKTQYMEAIEASVLFKNNHIGAELTILGHSLGGGLAIVGSLKTGIQCMTYNPAGLHKNTLANFGLSNSSTDNIQNYVNIGDGVSVINAVMPDISVPGNTHYCWNANSFFFGYSVLGLYLNHRAKNFK